VALAYGAGGSRWPYRVPATPVPELPLAEVDAPGAENHENAVVLSGIDTRFDRLIVQRMREAAESGDMVWLTASLSRISRNLGKLLRAMEYLLAHDVPVLTANYLLRPLEVWVRRGALVPVNHEDPLPACGSRGACLACTAPQERRPPSNWRPRSKPQEPDAACARAEWNRPPE